MRHCLTAISLFTVLLTACNGNRLQPRSGGRLYETLVVGDTNGIVQRALSTDVTALPQSEPDFDVSAVAHNGLNTTLQLSRNIVITDINSAHYSTVKITYEKDIYAHPQMVVNLKAPSAAALRQALNGREGQQLRQLLERSELNFTLSQLQNKRNTRLEETIRKMFGITLWVPLDMTGSRRGRNFLWISNNSATAMQNLVIYQLKGKPLQRSGKDMTHVFTTLRDSVMKSNIKGETDTMFMQTSALPVVVETSRERGQNLITFRGLWEVRGDAMGGPFVSHVVEHNGNTLVAEAFVFAPGKKKRNYLRQLEAVLYTLKQ